MVPYEQIDKKNFLTISPCGVTHYTNEMVFTKIEDWEEEYTIFVQLTDVNISIQLYIEKLIHHKFTLVFISDKIFSCLSVLESLLCMAKVNIISKV